MRHSSALNWIRFIAALLVVLPHLNSFSSARAQTTFSVTGGVNLLGKGFLDYQPVGFNAAAVVQIPLTRWMLIGPTLGYKVYPFSRDWESVWTDLPATVVSVEPLQQLFMGLALRLQLPSDSAKVVPFVDLAAGYEFERVGRITEDWGPGAYTTVSNPIYLQDWAHTAAAGLHIRLSTRFSLEPSYRWHARGKYSTYGMLSFDLVYALPL